MWKNIPTDSCRGNGRDAAVEVTVAAATDDDDDDGIVVLSPSSLAPRPLSVTDPPEPTLPSSPASSSAVASDTHLTAGHFTHTYKLHLLLFVDLFYIRDKQKQVEFRLFVNYLRTAFCCTSCSTEVIHKKIESLYNRSTKNRKYSNYVCPVPTYHAVVRLPTRCRTS